MENIDEFDIATTADELFHKHFEYKNSTKSRWDLNFLGSSKENLDCLRQLNQLKSSLNSVKSSLNDFDILKWSSHTNFTNPSAKILPHLRKTIHPELATQAWCKFYELLSYENAIPSNISSYLCSVHLCEAPGGFICALNHFLKLSHKSTNHSWVANTLNPYYEGNTLDSCIVDDRLISRTLRSWWFGSDNTGNVLSKDFISSFKSICSKTFHGKKIKLITADGSLNCQDDPSEQESIVAPLHYTELLCALSILSQGGNFIVKMFTLFEKNSTAFMYILCCLFDQVAVRKPATSKAGNSEVYIVAKGYCGLDRCSKVVELLKNHFPFYLLIRNKTDLISNENIPSSFMSQHLACVKLFADYQINAINRNIFLYNNFTDDLKKNMKILHDVVVQKFFDICNLKKLSTKQCIVPNGILRSNVKSNLQLRPKLEGSYTQRKGVDSEVDNCISENEIKDTWEILHLDWIFKSSKTFWWNTTGSITGKTVDDIHSSLFCSTHIIVQYEHAYEQLVQKEPLCLTNDRVYSLCNESLTEELKAIVSCHNHSFVAIVCKHADCFYNDWLLNIVKCSNPNITCIQVNYIENYIEMPPCQVKLIVSNFVIKYKNGLKWPELKIRFSLVKCIFYVVSCLIQGGVCLFILPSILMRLTGQIMWIFSQFFEAALILPIKLSNSDLHPAIIFIGKNFQQVHNYLPSLKRICDLVSADNGELLELFPITALLHTESAGPFLNAVRIANEKCLVELTSLLNRTNLMPTNHISSSSKTRNVGYSNI